MVSKVQAYMADDGSLHKTELEAHERNIRMVIRNIDPSGESFFEGAINSIWKHRKSIFDALRRIPGIDG